MALIIFKDRSLSVFLRHVEAKPNGSFQYRRRIPVCLRGNYPGKSFYVRSLGRDLQALARRAADITSELDSLWGRLKAAVETQDNLPDPGDSFGLGQAGEPQTALQLLVGYLTTSGTLGVSNGLGVTASSQGAPHAAALPAVVERTTIKLSLALALYLSHHEKGGVRKFRADAERVVNGVLTMAGDLPLSLYTRQQAQEYRDDLLSRNSTGTVRRRLDTLVAVFNKAVSEEGLAIVNPFESLSIPKEGHDSKKREAYTDSELLMIAGSCQKLDDDIRHIIALQLDTGARAGEIIGLRVSDVVLDQAIPHVRIRPFGAVRSLKTDASERDIPLIGNALWAAGRAIAACRKAADGSLWLFPRYASNKEVKATHASNTLNKWLRSIEGVSRDKTTHCFRHAMRDRLRAAQVPHDIQEAIGGWGTRTIGQGYGNGYPLQVLAEHMSKIVLP